MKYDGLAKLASNMLKSFGTPVKVMRGKITISNGYGVFGNEKKTMDESELLMQTTIKNRTITLSGLAGEPKIGDTLKVGKIEYTVSSVEALNPGGQVITYKAELT